MAAVIPLVVVRLLGMYIIRGSPKKKIEYVQLLQIECMAKERGGEKGRIFKEPVYMLWALARQIPQDNTERLAIGNHGVCS